MSEGDREFGDGRARFLDDAASVRAQLDAPDVPPFMGRAAELARLHGALQDARAGFTRVMLVAGLSGVGKSTLLDRFVRELPATVLVLSGRCHERESLSYKVFDSIVQALGQHLGTLEAAELQELLPDELGALLLLFPELGAMQALVDRAPGPVRTLDVREQRNQAFVALKKILLQLTRRSPVVLVVDDLQWGDIDSARMLSHVLGPSDAPPLLFLGAYRSDEQSGSEFLRELTNGQPLRSGPPEIVELGPLPDATALELVVTLLSARGLPHDSELAAALVAEAAGVPFFIGELVQYFEAWQRTARELALQPVTLEHVLAQRVAALPEPAQRLLRVLSVAARPLEQSIALEAAELPRNEQAALQWLRSTRLARSRGGAPNDLAESYHDRVRQAVLRALPEPLLRATHAAIAHALERRGLADVDRLAVHYLGAGDRSQAARSIERAAHAAAQTLAFNRSAELFERAIELLEDPARKRALARPLADALVHAGRGAQSARAYLAAAEGVEASEARKLERMAAQQYVRAGHLEQGIPLTARLLKWHGIQYPTSNASALLGLLLERVRLSMLRIDARRVPQAPPAPETVERLETLLLCHELVALGEVPATVLLSRYLREAFRHGDDFHLLRGVAMHAAFMALLEGERKRDRVEQLLAVADELAARVGTPYAAALVATVRAGTELCLGRPIRAEALSAQAEHAFRNECQAAHWEATYARTWRYGAIELGGDLSTLLREAPAHERDARERDDEYTIISLTLVLPQAHMLQDQWELALQQLNAAAARHPTGFNFAQLWIMDRTADALMYGRQSTQAWDYMQRMWPRFSRSLLIRSPYFRVNGYFLLGRVALAALRVRPSDRALAACVHRAVSNLRQHRRADATAFAELLAAGLLHRSGDVAGACEALERAIAACAENALGNFAWYAKYNLGLIGRDERARTLGAEADAALLAMGVKVPARWVAAYAPGFETP